MYTSLSLTAEAPRAAPPALLVDCGTGDTKVLLYSYTEGTVTVKEVNHIHKSATQYFENPAPLIDTIKKHLSQGPDQLKVMIGASAWLCNASEEELKER